MWVRCARVVLRHQFLDAVLAKWKSIHPNATDNLEKKLQMLAGKRNDQQSSGWQTKFAPTEIRQASLVRLACASHIFLLIASAFLTSMCSAANTQGLDLSSYQGNVSQTT